MAGLNLTTAAAVVLLLLLAQYRGELLSELPDAGPVDLGDDGQEQGQGGALLDLSGVLGALDLSPLFIEDTTLAERNTRAFLLTIRHAEGTAGPDGYRTLFGGSTFASLADHPRRAVRFTDATGRQLWTTAAGAYQFMAVSPIPGGGWTKVDTWDRLSQRLQLPDFGPAAQDAAALALIEDAGAMGDVRAGRFDAAVNKVRRIWASLPGAGYSQPERPIADLRMTFLNAGGAIA